MTSLSDDQIKYAKYRWEFLRRDPKYIKDWKKLQDTLVQKYGERMGPPTGQMPLEESAFGWKWKISCHLNPERSYDDYTTGLKTFRELSDRIRKSYPYKKEKKDKKSIDFDSIVFAVNERALRSLELDVHRIMFYRLFPLYSHFRPFEVYEGWEYEDLEGQIYRHVSEEVVKTGKIVVRIDLNHSKNRLINDFKVFIDEWKELYDKAFKKYLYDEFCKEREIKSHPITNKNLQKEFTELYTNKLKERKTEYEKKYHFDNYDDYLKVYDLRREGMSWAKIKNTLKLNSVQTARNHHNAACELIKKGIDLYVK
ncbi:MAG: hypothetical protein JRC89_09010 [Deltaproteobacteria bacterium]|nr:hypothetical protein [Deltaproteobacteria bacterium]